LFVIRYLLFVIRYLLFGVTTRRVSIAHNLPSILNLTAVKIRLDQQERIQVMLIKGIKKGKTIELLEEIDFPDNQEVLLEIRQSNNFWSALQEFRNQTHLEEIDDDSFEDLRNKSLGREVIL